jgi:sugar lactone lactonase YvrE
MNVTFGKNGDVYTAESNTGRIKRFTADGEFVDFIGDVKLVPGCKNVSIAVSKDGKRVFMLDITRNHVVVMDRKSQKSKGAAPSAE